MSGWHRLILGMLSAMALAATPVAAEVVVTFANPERFSDIGDLEQDPRQTLSDLEAFFHSLGDRYLPSHVTLRIEVLDISLAGRSRWPPRTNSPVRAMGGDADWPRFELRYTLESGSAPSRPIEETVVDRNYLRPLEWRYSSASLPYEKRMLEAWFRARFIEHSAPSGAFQG
jgi:Protein of unknown function (DUF3016)